jgi:hypothetical protein
MPGDPLDFSCTVKAGTVNVDCRYQEAGDNILNLSFALDPDEFVNRVRIEAIRTALTDNLCGWFGFGQLMTVETEKKDALAWDIFVSKKISSVGLDASLDADHRVFRWREAAFNEECASCPHLEKSEALSIVENAGVAITPDMVLAGYFPATPEEPVQCYTLRFEHWITDTTGDFIADNSFFKGQFPAEYRNSGSVIVEGDFLVLYIDSDKERVIGMHRKWRPAVLSQNS